MTSTTVLRSLRKWWWAVVVLTLIGGAAGALSVVIIAPTYKATGSLVVTYNAPVGASSSDLAQANSFAVQKAIAYQQIALSERVLSAVITDLGLSDTPEELALDLEVVAPLNTPILQLSGKAGTAQDAAVLSQAYITAFTNVITEVETPATGGAAPVRIETLQDPVAPPEPETPDLLVNTAVGLGAGLAVGLIWLAVAAATDRRIHTRDEITATAALSKRRILGGVPAAHGAAGVALVSQPLGREAEAYRTIAATLGHTPDARLGVVAIAAATPRDNTSALTANIALAMNEFGVRVAVIDANLRSGRLSALLGLTGPGLAEVLRGDAELTPSLHQTEGITVLAAGKSVDSPAELLSGAELGNVVKELRASHDMVFIDAPPALPLSDTIFAASVAQSTVLAVSAGRVTTGQLDSAAQALEAVGVEVIGVVMMNAPVRGSDADPSTSLYRELQPARKTD
ncbi:hypothetical protein DEA06_12740 [Microbacterium sp. Gd 4-13]|uniref:polysaccharide biosynthesis tyrosine autokinase n=1 Tax=Microbacterium sp. Gd 4-13 TaxID=2173179 RepID=UPI000D57446A|nr:polysaccharide biosynthesis tyrosine autokinase [Microbacterium sp. Gd 4-13]PVW03726.1 hypothetical protein DEA06_12740 [Microbacterium sp. Gd 4-13]